MFGDEQHVVVLGVIFERGVEPVARSRPADVEQPRQLVAPRVRGRAVALAATGFAIVGVLYGLSITTQGGDLPDIVYHATLLPVLIATFILLLLRTSKHISGNKAALEPSGQAVRPGS
jgi:hypothetical protein